MLVMLMSCNYECECIFILFFTSVIANVERLCISEQQCEYIDTII